MLIPKSPRTLTHWARQVRSPLGQRLASGIGWSISGNIFVSVLNLLVTLCIARILGREHFGQFVLTQSTVVTIGTIAGFGIGATVTRYSAHLRNTDKTRLSRIVSLAATFITTVAFIFTAISLLLANTIATTILKHADFAIPLQIASAAIFFSAIDGYQKSVILGFEAMRPLAVSSLAGVVLGAPVILLLANRYGISGAAAGLVTSAMAQAAVSRIQMIRILRRFGISRHANHPASEWRVLRDFSLPALLASTIFMVAHWLVQLLLARASGDFQQVALLGIAMQWFNATMLVPNLAGRVILPMLTERLAANREDEAILILKFAVTGALTIAIPIAIAISSASPWILSGYGQSFHTGAVTLALASWVAVLAVAAVPVGQMLAATDAMWLGVAMNFSWAAIYVLFACQYFTSGALGIMLSLGIAYLAHSTCVVIFAMRHFEARIRCKSAERP